MATDIIKNIVTDLKVELSDEFDKNFERKAFFDKPWKQTARQVSRGSLLMRTGALRQGNMTKADENGLTFSNSQPYAALHNDGGKIKVTTKMKKFFWAMYLKATGSITKRKDGTASTSKRNTALAGEAGYWKGLALMKVGKELTIPQRQFIGHHPQVDKMIRNVVDDNVQEFLKEIIEKLKRK